MDATPTDTRQLHGGAQGALREMLSTLSNLEQLLRSRNVGPRAVSTVLPDVLESCPALGARLAPLFEQTAASGYDTCATQLSESVSTQIADLSASLRAVGKRPLNAAGRLRLEATVTRVVRELGGIMPLIELLEETSEVPSPPSDWVEIISLSRSGDQSHPPGATVAAATLETACPSLFANIAPKAGLNVIRIVAALVFVKGEPLRVAFDQTAAHARVTVDRGAAEGRRVELVLPRVVAPTPSCLKAATRRLQLEMSLETEVVTLSWPRQATEP
jgi:hypothetical protein